MIETRKLLKECGYGKAIISSRSNEMTLISSDGTKYVIVDENDVYDYDDDVSGNNANEDEDDSYYYEVSDADENEEEGEGVEEGEAEEEIIEGEEREEEESEEEKNNEKQMPDSAIKMGQDLYVLRQHINKLPTPPLTNNCNVLENEKDYRKALINYLKSINSVDDFTNLNINIFVPITPSPSSSRKRSLSFILNEEEKDDNDDEPSRKRALGYILNEGDDGQKMDEDDDVQKMEVDSYNIFGHQININSDDPIINQNVVANINDPASILSLPIEEFENKRKVACTILTNIIIRIYNSSLKDQLSNEIIRRRQFRHLVLFYEYYEKLTVYCNLFQERAKGRTIKTQAIEMIVRSSKPSSNEPPQISSATISTILNKAFRIKRLLKIASNNYNIIDAFPDLKPYLFIAKKMGVVNFERWLELVRTGTLITFKEGEQKYERSKAEIKRERDNILRSVYDNRK